MVMFVSIAWISLGIAFFCALEQGDALRDVDPTQALLPVARVAAGVQIPTSKSLRVFRSP
jgi:hypothetical protein